MSLETTGIGFSSSTPAPEAGNQDIVLQSDGGSPLQLLSGYPKRATASLLGVVKPDGTSITVDGTGKISAAVSAIPTVIGFVMLDGSAGTNVGPMLAAPHAGTVTKCVVVVKAADGATALTFKIKQNGTDVFTTDPTIAAGTAAGTVTTFTSLTSSPLAVAAGDVFSIDITSGSSAWDFVVQLEGTSTGSALTTIKYSNPTDPIPGTTYTVDDVVNGIIAVVVGGVPQRNPLDWTAPANVITLTNSTVEGDTVYVVYF